MSIRSHQGSTPQLADHVFVDATAVVIGDVVIGQESSVWPQAVIRGDIHRIRIGQRTSVQDGAVLHVTHAGPFNPDGYPLLVGNEVTIGHKAVLHGCTLGNQVLVGIGAIVMDGAVVEDQVVIAAGSLVPPGKILPSGQLYMGSPARPARALTAEELRYFAYTANYYAQLAGRYRNVGAD